VAAHIGATLPQSAGAQGDELVHSAVVLVSVAYVQVNEVDSTTSTYALSTHKRTPTTNTMVVIVGILIMCCDTVRAVWACAVRRKPPQKRKTTPALQQTKGLISYSCRPVSPHTAAIIGTVPQPCNLLSTIVMEPTSPTPPDVCVFVCVCVCVCVCDGPMRR
jgi:hypothetical protein